MTWGESQKGGDSSMVQEQLRDVEQALSGKLGTCVQVRKDYKLSDVAGLRFLPGRGLLRTCHKAAAHGRAFAEAGSCVSIGRCALTQLHNRCALTPMPSQLFEPGSKQTTDCARWKRGTKNRRTFRGGWITEINPTHLGRDGTVVTWGQALRGGGLTWDAKAGGHNCHSSA